MRNFAYVNPEFEQDSVTPEFIEGNPCYEASAYDSVMLEELSDGSYMYMDMTSILLNQEKYRRLLGDMNVNDILAQMHPTQSTVMDNMTDEERFNCVISRHCQTMSERQAVLRQLANEKSELSALLNLCWQRLRQRTSSTNSSPSSTETKPHPKA